MTNPDGSPLEWIAKLPMFSWMRSKARDDHGHSDVPDLCGLDMKGKEPRQQQQQQQQPPKQQRSSPPQLCTKEESVSQTAPASTCDSSGASWSDMAVGSSDSSVGATHDMVTFHRLSEGVDGGPRRSPPPLTLTVDPEPALAPTAPPVDIPWRVVDPDSVSNPMQEALSHSLAQMEMRMSGRHTTKNAPTMMSSAAHNHRRALSALPIGRADVANGRPRAGLGEARGGAAPTSFWKQTPPADADAAAAAAALALRSFDEDAAPSPRERGAGGRRQGSFEGYFPAEDSTATADVAAAAADDAAAASAFDSASGSSSMQEEEGDVDDGDAAAVVALDDRNLTVDVNLSLDLDDGDEDDGADSELLFAFDDL